MLPLNHYCHTRIPLVCGRVFFGIPVGAEDVLDKQNMTAEIELSSQNLERMSRSML